MNQLLNLKKLIPLLLLTFLIQENANAANWFTAISKAFTGVGKKAPDVSSGARRAGDVVKLTKEEARVLAQNNVFTAKSNYSDLLKNRPRGISDSDYAKLLEDALFNIQTAARGKKIAAEHGTEISRILEEQVSRVNAARKSYIDNVANEMNPISEKLTTFIMGQKGEQLLVRKLDMLEKLSNAFNVPGNKIVIKVDSILDLNKLESASRQSSFLVNRSNNTITLNNPAELEGFLDAVSSIRKNLANYPDSYPPNPNLLDDLIANNHIWIDRSDDIADELLEIVTTFNYNRDRILTHPFAGTEVGEVLTGTIRSADEVIAAYTPGVTGPSLDHTHSLRDYVNELSNAVYAR
jgi:hypothetical protein